MICNIDRLTKILYSGKELDFAGVLFDDSKVGTQIKSYCTFFCVPSCFLFVVVVSCGSFNLNEEVEELRHGTRVVLYDHSADGVLGRSEGFVEHASQVSLGMIHRL